MRIIAIICLTAIVHSANAQTLDSIKCDEYFKYFDGLFKDQVITLWSTAPVLKESNAPVLSNLCDLVLINSHEQFMASLILDTKGKPMCIRTYPEIKTDSLKNIIINLLYMTEFEPAIIDKEPVISCYGLIFNNQKCDIYKNMNKRKKM